MTLCSLENVLVVCNVPEWVDDSTLRLTVVKESIPFNTLRELEEFGIFFTHATPSKLKSDFDKGSPGQLEPSTVFTLSLPRIVQEQVVARDLGDLLSLPSATSQTPGAYFLLSGGEPAKPFCLTGESSLEEAPTLVKIYHEGLKLWGILERLADHTNDRDALMFFGIRRIQIDPGFAVADLNEDIPIAVKTISEFVANTDRQQTRAEIFRSVLSEFLRDQPAERAFAYLLRTSKLFALRLLEGLAIYLSANSPEKLNEQAVAKHFELAEKLEKVISGMEAKSLTIPAAVLLAIKEVKFGEGWVTLNTIILISAALYFVAMTIAHLSQRAMLELLKTSIEKATKDLCDQGLDDTNPVLAVSFKGLRNRQRNSAFGSWLMWALSAVPLVAVIYTAFLIWPPKPPAVTEPPMRIIPALETKHN